MALTAEQVIVELEAKIDRYQRDVQRAVGTFERGMRKIEGDSRHMEAAIRRDAASVSATFKGLAGSLAAGFSAQRVGELADGYTRFTNQLKVAGIEGQALGKTQERLFGIAQKYGVQLEAIGELYGSNAASAKELNLSQEQQYKIVQAVSASLQISGKSAAESAGALLQLTQVLGGTTVQAEEYNSLIDGARPLLQAVAAGSDRWSGSVARLTRDVKDGKVKVTEFVQALLKGADGAIARADQATLTLSAAFTTLNNALGKYIGETDQSLSATERISQAIGLLAQHLDTVAKGLSVIAAVLVGRFAAGMVAAAGSTVLVSNAIFALQARALGAATSLEALAFAGATAGRSLLAVFGGPIGIAVTALSIAIGVVATKGFDAAKASREYSDATDKLVEAQKKRADLEERIATATGKTRDQTLKSAEEARKRVIIEGNLAVALLRRARAEVEAQRISARATLAAQAKAMGGGSGTVDLDKARTQGAFMGGNVMSALFGGGQGSSLDQAEANLAAASEAVLGWDKELARLDALIKGASTTAPSPEGKKKKATGPSPEEIEARYVQDVARLQQERIQAELGVATSAEKRLELQNQLLDIEYNARLADILADKHFSDQKKAAYIAQLKSLYGRDNGDGDDTSSPLVKANLRAHDRQVAEEERSRADALANIERQMLQSTLSVTDSRAARKAIELRLLDLAYEEERRALEDQKNDATISEKKREEAQLRLDRLGELKAADQAGIDRQYEGPMANYLRSIPDTADEINDALEAIAVNGLRDVEDGFARAATKALGLKGALGGVVEELIRMVFQQQIFNALSGGGGGFLGALGKFFGATNGATGLAGLGKATANLPKFAQGGIIPVGGFGGVDRNVLSINGRPRAMVSAGEHLAVIPSNMGIMPQRASTTIIQNFTLDARGGITTPQLLQQVNNTITQAGTVAAMAGGAEGERRVMKRAGRRIPW